MKLIVRIQLLPDADQAAELKAVTERFNAAADWLSAKLFECGVANKIEAQRLFYREIRDRFGLSSQTAILCIHRACEAYQRDKSVRPRFRKDGAMTYDVRTMSFKGIDRVSLLVLTGRLAIPMIVTAYQAERMGYPKGQCDLVLRKDGKWFLMVTVDVPDGTPIDPEDFIGVDLGIAKIATDSESPLRPTTVGPTRGPTSTRFAGSTTCNGSGWAARTPRGARRRLSGSARRKPDSAATKITGSASNSLRPPSAPDAGSPSKSSTASRDGSRLGAEKHGIGSRVGPLPNSAGSSCTRPDWRASPWNTSTRGTPVEPVPSAGIARSPIARANPNSDARHVATRPMPT